MFPSKRIIEIAEAEVLVLSRELGNVIASLSDAVHGIWRCNGEDLECWHLLLKLIRCGVSVTNEPWIIGRWVIKKSRPYWIEHSLITELDLSLMSRYNCATCIELAEAIRKIEEGILSRVTAVKDARSKE